MQFDLVVIRKVLSRNGV